MIIERQSAKDVLEYLQIVQNRFPDNREIYGKITKLLKDLRLARPGFTYNDVISKVSQLFKEHKDLLLGFNQFLPPGYKITLPEDQTQRKKPELRDASEFLNKVKERLQDEHAYKSLLEILRMFKENKKSFTEVHHEREGQLKKERETRDVERALNVVEEMERAEEQFVKEMEVTRRNWEPASQVMTVVGVWRRDGGRRIVEKFEGFDMLWHVGLMEVRGVGEVRRKGKMVGEGFGEREGAFILMLNVARLIFVYGIANHLNVVCQGSDPTGGEFSFNGLLYAAGSSNLNSNGLFRLTNSKTQTSGQVFYNFPLRFKGSASGNVFSFSTTFVFAIVSGAEVHDIDDNHVGIDINSVVSEIAASAGYFKDDGTFGNISLTSRDSIQLWVEYDSKQKRLNVTLHPVRVPKPKLPLLSLQKDLCPYLLESMYVGFTSSTGMLTASHYILALNFKMNGTAQDIDLSRLPEVPRFKQPWIQTPKGVVTISLTTSGVTILIMAFLEEEEAIEDWEVLIGLLIKIYTLPQRVSRILSFLVEEGLGKSTRVHYQCPT
ncbi:unnamed protein product [Brassica rapa]|uniref:Legume lectin domain-containing protein n=2 Tax=Brassica TaxID=3705 RepID=A0A8D9H5I1_BRACM|nr:unnamed protein product [Brassica napus]CAG7893220.1 unnamed protein product [Brassica rapa]